MGRHLNIACLQTRPCADFDSALAEALMLAEQAADAGAQVLALPEYCGGLKTEGSSFIPPSAEETEHPVLRGLQDLARARRVCVMVGSVAVPSPDGRIANRSFVISEEGSIMARYDKLHLFDIQLPGKPPYRESDKVSAGQQAVVVDMLGTKIGLSICYDLRFPDLYRTMAQAGAEILMVPAAFTRITGGAHWHVLNRARAIENGAFVIAPCAIGPVDGGGESYGHSLIINPWGEVLADGGTSPGIIQCQINTDEVAQARSRIPSLTHGQAFTLQNEQSQEVA